MFKHMMSINVLLAVLIFAGDGIAQVVPADTPVAAAKAATTTPVASANDKGSCEAITSDAPAVEGVKPIQLCPAIKTLVEVFRDASPDNYAAKLSYSDSPNFYEGLASSMKHYSKTKFKNGLPIFVSITPTMLTLDGMNTLDPSNQYKRNKLGLILERIATLRGKGGHVCVSPTTKSTEGEILKWAGAAFLKYGLPALIKLFAGDPSKNIDKYDALVYVDQGAGPMTKWPVNSIYFYTRGNLPADVKCKP